MAIQTSTIQPDAKNVYRRPVRKHPKHHVTPPPGASMSSMKQKFPFIGLAGKQKKTVRKGLPLL